MDKRTFPGLLLSALALLAWCGALFSAQGAGDLAGGVTARWSGEGAGVSPAALTRYERWAVEDEDENFPHVTLWREASAFVTDAGGDRSVSASVLELFGDAARVWPVAFRVGGYPIRGDGVGCAVDRSVAEALWGSADAVGNELKLNGTTYVVRGVFEGVDGLILTQEEAGSAEAFSQLLLSFPEGTTKDGAESWLATHDAGGGVLLDLPLLSWLWSLLALLPALTLALGLLLRLVRRGWSLRHTPLLLGAYLIPAVLAGTAALWCVGSPGVFPTRLLPDRWSDFGFWPETLGALAGEIRAYLAAPGARDFRYWGLALGCILLSLVAVGFTVLAAERIRVRTERGMVLGGCAAILGAFGCAVLFAPAGGVELPRSVWLLPTLWLWTDWALGRHRNYLSGGGARHETEIA